MARRRTVRAVPLRRIRVEGAPPTGDRARSWPWSIPAVDQLVADGLELGAVTVLVGENGSGKSTLVEAIAMAFGMSGEGGTPMARHRTRATESELGEYLTLVREPGGARWGFFLRAETMHGLYTYIEDHAGPRPEPVLHEMSHGESFLALLDSERFRGPGLFLLDEPESALSFQGCLQLVAELHERARTGGAQMIVATHSPLVAAVPGARILELGPWGIRPSGLGRPRARAALAIVPARPADVPAASRTLRSVHITSKMSACRRRASTVPCVSGTTFGSNTSLT